MLKAKNDIILDGRFIVEGDVFEATPEQRETLFRLGWAEEVAKEEKAPVEEKPKKATKKK